MIANGRAPLRSVAVVGGGLVALAAAIGFARALPHAVVTLVRTPLNPAALADRLPASWPATAPVLDTLGIGEDMLVRAGAATHRLGDRFADWGSDFSLSHGEGVAQLAGASLHQLWLAHDAGAAFDGLIPAAALLGQGRFAHPASDPADLLSRIDYAVRLDATRAVPVFAEVARRAGVRFLDGDVADLGCRDHGLDTVRLIGGESIAADFFVDATGPAAMLSPGPFVAWRAALSCDRLLLWQRQGVPVPADDYRATGTGWQARWPLADRTLAGFAYAADITTDARARRLAGDGAREAALIAITPGRRATPLAGNVLALGDAAVATGALGWAGFPLALAHLALALDLMPARAPDPLLIAEYNRRATIRADRLRDFLAALYLVPDRKGDLWQALRDRPRPDALAATLAQFAQRGRLPHREDDMVTADLWTQALIGMGVRPCRRDPVALSVPADAARRALARLRAAVADLPARVPPYPAYLAHLMEMPMETGR